MLPEVPERLLTSFTQPLTSNFTFTSFAGKLRVYLKSSKRRVVRNSCRS